MLLSDTVGLEYIVLKLLQGSSGIKYQEGQKEHSLILALQLLQECLCILTIGGKVRGNDIHVVSGTNRLLLFLNLASIQLCNRMLNRLDGLVLIHRLNMHGHNLAGLHTKEICQHSITDIRSIDGKEAHGSIHISHLKYSAILEIQATRCDKVLHRKAGTYQPFPVKEELCIISDMEL